MQAWGRYWIPATELLAMDGGFGGMTSKNTGAFSLLHAPRNWIPAFAGMTSNSKNWIPGSALRAAPE